MARDGGLCQYCGSRADSIDHVVPRSRGGTHTWENVVAACRPCNVRKRDRMLHETSMGLRRRPAAPRGATWSIVAHGTVPGDWEPYLLDRPRLAESAAARAGEARTWHVERITGSAGVLHGLEIPSPLTPTAWVFTVDRPALVLGSTQSDDVVDHAAARAAGVEVARRRSGGGAVWLEPGGTSWVDVLVPASDPLWDDDVGRAAYWLGDAWAGAIGAVGRGASAAGWSAAPRSGRACFAGLGPGEVTIGRPQGGRHQPAPDREQAPGSSAWPTSDGIRRPLARLLRLSPDSRDRARSSRHRARPRWRGIEEGAARPPDLRSGNALTGGA